MTVCNLSDARKNFSKIIESVQNEGEQFVISVNGKVAATLVSYEDYESLLETLEILQDKALIKDIKKSEKQYEKGDYISLNDLMSENVSSNINKRSTKRAKTSSNKNL